MIKRKKSESFPIVCEVTAEGAAEAGAADREKAEQISALNAQFKEQLEDADEAFSDAISSVLSARDLLMKMHTLGVAAPIDQQFRINVVACHKNSDSNVTGAVHQ
jgi:hypothetical protein